MGDRLIPPERYHEVPEMARTDSRKVNQRRRLQRQRLENRKRLNELKANAKPEAKS
jgi:hypothetical protein